MRFTWRTTVSQFITRLFDKLNQFCVNISFVLYSFFSVGSYKIYEIFHKQEKLRKREKEHNRERKRRERATWKMLYKRQIVFFLMIN